MSIASSAPHRAGSVASVGASASGLSVYYSYLHDGTLSPLAGTGEMVSPFWAKRRELGLHGARGKEIIKLRALLHSVVVDWFELTVSEKSRNVLKTIKLSSRRLRWLRAHCLQQFAGYVQKRRRSRRLQRLGESAARRAAQRLLQVSLSLSLNVCLSFSLSRARASAREHARTKHTCVLIHHVYIYVDIHVCTHANGYVCTEHGTAELHGRGHGHARIDACTYCIHMHIVCPIEACTYHMHIHVICMRSGASRAWSRPCANRSRIT